MKNQARVPMLDLFFGGGLTLLFIPLAPILYKLPDLTLWWMNAAISFPHFLATYLIFYGPGGSWRKHKAISILSPILLAVALGFAFQSASIVWLRRMTHVALMLFYWHYLKQTFGVSLWVGTNRRPEKAQKDILLAACLILGVAGYLCTFNANALHLTFGMQLDYLPFPPLALQVAAWAPLVAMLGFSSWLAFQKFRSSEFPLSWRCLLPLSALWVWVDPYFVNHPLRALLPFFHGMQYLPFPGRVFAKGSLEAGRSHVWTAVAMFGIAAGCLGVGYLLIQAIPHYLSTRMNESIPRVPVMAVLFFNFHHYLIDAVAWRFREPAVLARLLSPAMEPKQKKAA